MLSFLGWIAAVQAAYYLISGVWPLVHMRSFLAVTGPKQDLWLVRCVASLIVVIGAALALATWKNQCPPPVALLAMGSAAALLTIDVVYSVKGVISKIYLLDAAAELLLLLAWIYAAFLRQS
jgi:hypothetical protein